jgi:hypothetical protein
MSPIGLLVWMKKKKDGYQPAKARRSAGIKRVIAYTFGMMAVVGTCSLHSAKADIAESSMALGRELAPLADLLHENNKLLLNGQPVFVSTGSTKQSLKTVLDRYEDHCRSHNAAFAEAWKDVPELFDENKVQISRAPDGKKAEQAAQLTGMGIVRHQNPKEGVVMCLVRDEGVTFRESIKEFGKTQDLGKIGRLRYAYVTTDPGTKSSFVITAWTEGKFNLGQFVPQGKEDAYGTDSPDYPRPPSSQRMLSASLDGTPYGVRIYGSAAEPKQVIDFYDQQMDTSGWQVIAPPNAEKFGRIYMKGNVEIALASAKNSDGNTVVSLGEMGVAPEKGILPRAH